MREAQELNPEAIRTRQSHRKVLTDREFVERFIAVEAKPRQAIPGEAAPEMSVPTVDRYLRRLLKAGLMASGGGLYWRAAE